MLNEELKAAEQGDAKAQGTLGWCYHRGFGVVKDAIEAYKWYLLAEASGDAQAGAARTSVAMEMPTVQIAEAEARAKQWQQEFEQSHPAKC